MEKLVTTLFAAFSPILFSYIFKNLENKNKSNIRKNELDEAQKRLDFLKSYYDVQVSFGSKSQSEQLMARLYDEIESIKANVDAMYREKNDVTAYGKLYIFQKIFLTFKPVSIWGWILHILFYLGLTMNTFLFLGYFVDDEGNFTGEAFTDSINNLDLLLGTTIFIGGVVGINLLALWNYRTVTQRG